MSALIWKELREHLRWALIMMLALGAAEIYALYQTRNGPEYYDYSWGVTLCKTGFLIVTSFGSATAGLLLGLIQVLPELKRDRWAALLHRPVPRETIFLGKIVAGMMLYAVAVLPPFLWCLWLAATPGHFAAPFVPEMTRPGFADLAAGLVYYLAAVLLSLQRGRFVLAKILPLFAALHLSIFTVTTIRFSDALSAAAAMALVLGIAARSAMRSQELFDGRSWLGRAMFIVVAFYGLCGLGDLVSRLFNAAVTQPFSWSYYEVTNQGLPVKLNIRNSMITSIEDLDGKAPQDPNAQPDRIRNHLHYFSSITDYIGEPHGFVPFQFERSYRETYTYLWPGNPYTFPQLEQWFYLLKKKTLVGVYPNRRVTIGQFGANGFQRSPAATKPFAPSDKLDSMGIDAYLVYDTQRILRLNFPSKETRELRLPAPGPIYGVGAVWGQDDDGQTGVIGAALSAGIAIFDGKDGTPITMLPYHRDVEKWGTVSLGLNGKGDRFLLWYRPSGWLPEKDRQTMPAYLDEVDRQGNVLKSYTLPAIPDSIWQPNLTARAKGWLRSPALFYGTLLYQKIGGSLGDARLKKALARQLGPDWPTTRRIGIQIAVMSLFLAVGTFFWARRAQFSERSAWAWAGLALAFNFAGFLIFRFVADWPRMVPCPSCARKRPVELETCPHCHQGWATAAGEGVEIFDQPNRPSPVAITA